MTDRQWERIGPLLPEPGTGGRPVKHSKREVVNAILYHVRAGGSWRMLPKDLPPWQTVYGYLRDWRKEGTLVSAASVQDRDGGRGILKLLKAALPTYVTSSPTAATADSSSRSPKAPGTS